MNQTENTAPIEKLLLTPAATITPKKQRWLHTIAEQGVIPLGTGAIFAGVGSAGKSTFALDIVARLTQGTLTGDLEGTKRAVIIFGPEDDWATVMVPRLMGTGADLEYVYQVQAEVRTDTFTRERELKFPVDLSLLREAIEEVEPALVIIDPAPSLMNGDMNKVQDVRSSYEPLMALAQEKDLTFLLINHFSKGAGSVGAKLSGSHAWRDLTRCYLAFAVDDETNERIITQDKNNYGTGLGSWKFTLESVEVALPGGETTSVARVNFLGESEVSVNEVINRGASFDDEDRNDAERFILEMLRDQPDHAAQVKKILAAGKAEGFTVDQLKNARKRAKNPKITTSKGAMNGGWLWSIESEGVTETPKVSPSKHVTPFDTLMTPSGNLDLPSISEIVEGVTHGSEGVMSGNDDTLTPSAQVPRLCVRSGCSRKALDQQSYCGTHFIIDSEKGATAA